MGPPLQYPTMEPITYGYHFVMRRIYRQRIIIHLDGLCAGVGAHPCVRPLPLLHTFRSIDALQLVIKDRRERYKQSAIFNSRNIQCVS